MATPWVEALPRPVIAVIGRPNVGKSTLCNRLVGRRQHIVSPHRGTTRDAVASPVTWRGRPMTLLDTGGFDLAARDPVGRAVQQRLRDMLPSVDGILMVCDGTEGLVPMDSELLATARTANKPVVVAVNKLDERRELPTDFFSMGAPQLVGISALHGRGIGELLDTLHGALTARPVGARVDASFSAAIVGRQNVGKSSLLNALLREERVLISDEPGTTRDAVDTLVRLGAESVRLIDTAGLRHRRKVHSAVDAYAMARSVEAIERCDVALVVLDATQGLAQDDQRIIDRVMRAGRGLVLLWNKWDVAPRERQRVMGQWRPGPSAAAAPVVVVSAKTGYQVRTVLPAAREVWRRMMAAAVGGTTLTSVIQSAWQAHPPPRVGRRLLRLREVQWLPGRPLRAMVATTPPGKLPATFRRYLLGRLYALPALSGVSLDVADARAAHRDRTSRRSR